MTVLATNASKELMDGNASPHQLISLLMAGMLERVAQAKKSIIDGNSQDETVLLGKVVAIINGLRDSLNFEQGGEIAVNLDGLYEYMITRISEAEDAQGKSSALSEVEKLMGEVKSGWDGVPEVVAA